jgi:hypothetical protein
MIQVRHDPGPGIPKKPPMDGSLSFRHADSFSYLFDHEGLAEDFNKSLCVKDERALSLVCP